MPYKTIIVGVCLMVALFAAFIIKYPLSNAQDPQGAYGWNVLGVYAKGRLNVCNDNFFNLPCISINIPYVNGYKYVPGVNTSSFKVVKYLDESSFSDDNRLIIKPSIAIDNNNIIYYAEIVPGSDPRTLKVYDNYAADIKNVYFNGRVATDFDTKTFTYIGCGFVKDKAGVYVYPSKSALVDFIDADSFTLTSSCENIIITSEDKNFYYKASGSEGFYIDGKKKESNIKYNDYGCGYSLIQDDIYHKTDVIKMANFSTFRSFILLNVEQCKGDYYAKDNAYVYYGKDVIRDVDVLSFNVFQVDYKGGIRVYAYDKNNVYLHGSPVSRSNPGPQQDYVKEFTEAYKSIIK